MKQFNDLLLAHLTNPCLQTATGVYSEPLPSPGPPLIINKVVQHFNCFNILIKIINISIR